jgi:hypothetical protein
VPILFTYIPRAVSQQVKAYSKQEAYCDLALNRYHQYIMFE